MGRGLNDSEGSNQIKPEERFCQKTSSFFSKTMVCKKGQSREKHSKLKEIQQEFSS